MADGYQIGASALTALDRWQDVVGSNIAMNAPGGKQSVVGMEQLPASYTEAAENAHMRGSVHAVVKKDFSNGAVVRTGNPTDVAIRGDKGFFGAGGGEFFTRDGEFHWNAENVLVTKEGIPVDGDGGNITKTTGGGQVAIDVRGNVFQGGAKIAKIAIYEVNPQDLNGPNGKLELVDGAEAPAKLEGAEVASEYLESPNGSKTMWMSDLIRLKHSQEAVGKMISSIDELYARAARYAGDT